MNTEQINQMVVDGFNKIMEGKFITLDWTVEPDSGYLIALALDGKSEYWIFNHGQNKYELHHIIWDFAGMNGCNIGEYESEFLAKYKAEQLEKAA